MSACLPGLGENDAITVERAEWKINPKQSLSFLLSVENSQSVWFGASMPLVSVVIPAYNCSLYIRETIQSILQQECASEIEVIVINDGSTDDTGNIARSFGEQVRVIDQQNSGVCKARNRGIAEAKGEFIALVDHDDYWLPHKLANQLAAFEQRPEVGAVFTGFVWWHPDESDGKFKIPVAAPEKSGRLEIDEDFSGWIYHQMLLDSWILTSTAVIRSDIAKAVGGFDELLPFSEDWDFWLRVSRDYQFLKLRESTTLYRQHGSQGSRVVREIDYRTQLLEKASKKWGLCSRDGRCLTPQQFNRQLSKYYTAFGLGHLKGGKGANRRIAARAFLKAYSIDYSSWRNLAYLLAMQFGWKPKW